MEQLDAGEESGDEEDIEERERARRFLGHLLAWWNTKYSSSSTSLLVGLGSE